MTGQNYLETPTVGSFLPVMFSWWQGGLVVVMETLGGFLLIHRGAPVGRELRQEDANRLQAVFEAPALVFIVFHLRSSPTGL